MVGNNNALIMVTINVQYKPAETIHIDARHSRLVRLQLPYILLIFFLAVVNGCGNASIWTTQQVVF